jgi:membrane protein implicated in regulation of membrane protease activity
MGRRKGKIGKRMMMKNERWISRAAKRYLIIQLPGGVLFVISLILIRRWVDLPAWLFWGLIVLWVGKDVVLFPLVRKAYEPQEGGNPMIGALGVVENRLSPSGYVRIGGELWKAHVTESTVAIDRGETVRVRAVEGLTLIVEHAADRPGEEQD